MERTCAANRYGKAVWQPLHLTNSFEALLMNIIESKPISAIQLFKPLLAAAVLCTAMAAPARSDQYTGPVFGLATTPNGDILAADSGAGTLDLNSDRNPFPAVPGITDIAPIGRSSLWVTRSGGDGLSDTGQALLRVSRGEVREIANLWDFELNNNPQTDDVRSNPFDVHALDGDAALVADAAANDLLHIDSEGNVEAVAIFPTRPASLVSLKAALGCPESLVAPICFMGDVINSQAVSTSIAVGPDGYYYVGELRGFPGPLDQSRIWRVAPWAEWADCASSVDCEVVFDGGFTSIIDLAFGPDGLLYVVEFDENGWFAAEVLHRPAGGTINACDVATLQCVEVATGILYVTAITFGKDGQLWATQNAIIPPLASVIAIP
jgi:hypothetical protein